MLLTMEHGSLIADERAETKQANEYEVRLFGLSRQGLGRVSGYDRSSVSALRAASYMASAIVPGEWPSLGIR